jgi:hypothetical protein
MQAYFASLRLLLEEDIEYIAPAHGFLIDHPRRAVEWLLRHRTEREQKVVAALLRAQSADVETLVPIAYDDVPPRVHPVASRSLLAHLLKLEAEGRAAQSAGCWHML